MSENLNIQESIATLRQRSDVAARGIMALADVDLIKQENWETEDELTENDRIVLRMLNMVSQRMRCQLTEVQGELNKINNKISDIALLSENNAVNENEIMAVSWQQEMLHQRLNSLSATLNAVRTTTSYMRCKTPITISSEISIDFLAPTITSNTENFTVSSPISVFTGDVAIGGTLTVQGRAI